MTCGVYKIVNKANGKFYIGGSKNIKRRWKLHIRTLRCNNHHNLYLQRAWNKYGESSFEFYIVEECEISLVKEKEQEYLDKLMTWKKTIGYNISSSAIHNDTLTNHPNIDKIKSKISKSLKKYHKTLTDEQKQEMNKKNSDSLKGRVFTKEHLRNKSLAQMGNKNPAYGKPWKEERKKAYSDKMKGVNNCQIMRQVSVNGIIYESVSKAVLSTGISRGALRYRLDSYKFKEYFYIDTTKQKSEQTSSLTENSLQE